MLFIIKNAKQKFTALTCNKCNVMAEIKTPEDFAKYVSYSVGKHEADYEKYYLFHNQSATAKNSRSP